MNRDNSTENVSSHLTRIAALQPFKKAVVYPESRDKNGRVAYTHLTFRQLDIESDRLAHGLVKSGIKRGVKTILMVGPGIDFFIIAFALFKTGAVPVVVDPGMGLRRMVECFKATSPEAFIGMPHAHILRVLYPKFFKTVKTWVTVGKAWFWGSIELKHIRQTPWRPFKFLNTGNDEKAAILFTTGSTGPAKGVVYTHGTFNAQIRHIKSYFAITENEIDLPTFPLFALFDPALGMTAVIPDMDSTKPAQVNSKKIIEAVVNHGVTNMFASPALLNRVGTFCSRRGIKLTSLKRVISAGAPVLFSNIKQFSSILHKDAQIHTPYGATEAMPVISIESREILSETGELSKKGYGNCIGRPIKGVDVQLIKTTDKSIEKWSDDIIADNGEIGEITVSGDVVTKTYYKKSENSLSKIIDKNRIWHRMGDLGWKDKNGRIWFCGRKSHRIITENGTLYTIPCEAIFNNHPKVYRSALVGVGTRPKQRPVICIELNSNTNKKKIKTELLELGNSYEMTKGINTILFHKSFPVDIRHNSKIFREKLAVFAGKKVKSC